MSEKNMTVAEYREVIKKIVGNVEDARLLQQLYVVAKQGRKHPANLEYDIVKAVFEIGDYRKLRLIYQFILSLT